MSGNGTGADPGKTLFRVCRWLRATVPTLLLLASLHVPAQGRVLTNDDLARLGRIKSLFMEVVTDVAQSSQRSDLASGDSDCVKSVLRALMQISEELSPYEYLLTIETELKDFGNDDAMRSILRFALENGLKILETERKRMGEILEQCSRFPLSAGKARQATQFIEGTMAILKSVRPRL